MKQNHPESLKVIGNFQYNTKHCIGEGSYGKVYEGVELSNKRQVAIKQLHLNSFINDSYLSSQLLSEINILKTLHHQNIVELIEVLQTSQNLYIITEFCSEGDLREQLKRVKRFPEEIALFILSQLLCGFEELVRNNVIHRDLKPANILVASNLFKIADFGFAKFNNQSAQLMRSCVGSPLYMPPQILCKKPYGSKCDVWSLGVIFYEMLFGMTPWNGKDEPDLIRNIFKRQLNIKNQTIQISKLSQDILVKTLALEESDRISWQELFQLKKAIEVKIQSLKANVPLQSNQQLLYQQQQIKYPQNIPTQNIQLQQKLAIADNIQQEQSNLRQMFNYIRSELSFKHYVCVEIQTKKNDLTNFLKQFSNGSNNLSLLIEKFLVISSQLVRQASLLVIQEISDKENRSPEIFQLSNEMKIITTFLQKESKFYEIFYTDIIEALQKNVQTFNNLIDDKEIANIIEGELSDWKRENCIALIIKYGLQLINLIKTAVSSNFETLIIKNQQSEKYNFRDILVLLDYIIDFVGALQKKQQSGNELQFSRIHAEKSEILINKNSVDRLFLKISKLNF